VLQPITYAAMLKLQDGKLSIYNRPNTRFYHCGFYHKRKPVRQSTGTDDLEKAKDFARQWYFNKQAEILSGKIAPTSNAKSFAVAAEKALEAYKRDVERDTRSESYYKGLEKLIRNRIVPVLGKHGLDSINQVTWNGFKEHLMTKKRPIKAKTIHQYKIAIRVVLKQAQIRGEISSVPQFLNDHSSLIEDTPRTWFNADEYKTLYTAVRAKVKESKGTRWYEDAQELRDYVLFVTNSGLRVGEACNVRLCDVEITRDSKEQREHLLIRNIKGKRGTGTCKSYYGAVRPFLRCLERHGLTRTTYRQSSVLLFKAYHRDMFKDILTRTNLRFTNDRPPRRRDLMSLRHTYICFRLLQGVPVYDIANNCRTSVEMIQNHYARWLSPSLSKSINMTAPKAVFDVSE
jgi:integrase